MRARSHAPSGSATRMESPSTQSRGSEGRTRPSIVAGKPASRPTPAPLPPKCPESGKPERMPNASRSVNEKLACLGEVTRRLGLQAMAHGNVASRILRINLPPDEFIRTVSS
jgi:hypothetical protein